MAIWWWVKWIAAALLCLFVFTTALRAIFSAYNSDGFPEALLVKVELLPVIFPVHMVAGGLALLLVPCTYYFRGTRHHRWLGRLTAGDVIVAGVTALPVALTAPVTPMAAAGFSIQGLVWLALIGKGIWHIKRHEIRQHQNAMMMMAAVTSGAMFFRIYLALWAIYGTLGGFKTFYACDAWMAWLLPLAITTIIIIRPFPFAKRGYAGQVR